ncbi:MAG: PAS domain S-box protein [Bacillota bacterium]
MNDPGDKIVQSEWLQSLFNYGLDLQCVADIEGNFLKVNKAWEDILGYSACELQARKFLEFVHPDDLQATYDAMAALGEKQSIIGFTNRYRCKDGSYRYIEWNSYPDGELIFAVARDVTDRKEKERELDAVASEMQDLYDNAPCGYHSLDTDGVIVRINDTELGWLGYTREEVVGKKNFEEILTPKSKDIFRKSFPNQKKLGGVSDLEYDFVRKDGTILSVILNASNIVDSSGNYIMSRAMSVDVTERKQFEEELARDEKYLSDLINSIEDIFYVLDARGNILKWNSAFVAVSGYTPADLASMNALELFAGVDIDRVRQSIGKVFSTGRASVEAEFLTKYGKKIPMLLSGSILDDLSHQPVLCGTGKDISALKRREEELRASEARYRTYIEVTGQIAWITPPDGVVDDIPEWRKYTGQTLDEVMGWGWLNAMHPDDREHTVEMWNRAVETRSLFETEYRIRRSDGVFRYFISRGIPSFHADGTIHEWVGTCIDITDRRDAELRLSEINELLKAEVVRANMLAVDAEAANVAKSNFVANVSHEIRTPMNGILGFVHLLEQTEIDEEQAEIIQTIKDSTDTLLTVINDVLDMSKIEAGKMDIELIPFDLSATVEGVVRVFNARAREKGLEINSLIRTNVPQFVVGDPTRLKQMLVNLVGNAVKFTEKGYVFVEVELK